MSAATKGSQEEMNTSCVLVPKGEVITYHNRYDFKKELHVVGTFMPPGSNDN